MQNYTDRHFNQDELYAEGDSFYMQDTHLTGVQMNNSEDGSFLRKQAEYEYSINAFDYVANPIGSRDWCIYWEGFKKGSTAITGDVPAEDALYPINNKNHF